MAHQTYQNFTELTSNMIYIVAFGGGLKCPRKIHLNTQCPPSSCPRSYWMTPKIYIYLCYLSKSTSISTHFYILGWYTKQAGCSKTYHTFFYNNHHQVSSTIFELFIIWATISKIYQLGIGYALKHIRHSSSSLTGVFWKKKKERAISIHRTNCRSGGRSQNLGGSAISNTRLFVRKVLLLIIPIYGGMPPPPGPSLPPWFQLLFW